MTTTVFLVVLTAAALHASWNALIKHGGDPVFRLAVAALTGSVMAVPLLPLVPVPPAAAWPWLLGSVLTHIGYYVSLALAYRTGDLSLAYPVARGVAPPLVALGALLVAGERLGVAGAAAVALICAGILALVLLGGVDRERRGSLLPAFACGATIAAYTVCDGQGVRAAGAALGYITWLFFVDGLTYGLAVLWRRRARLRRDGADGVRPAVAGGVLSVAAYGLVIWAMQTTPMGLVSALRETSVVLAAVIGTRLLGEPFGQRRIAATVLVAGGILALRWG
jgi:drug/metabolite transporter (DMT)-like permease